eukprot:g590.t1
MRGIGSPCVLPGSTLGRHLFLLSIAAIPEFAGATRTASDGAGGIIKVNTSTGLFVDGYGRARFFHGVNAVEKVAPFLPAHGPNVPFDMHRSLNADDMRFLHDEWGFNLVRLGVLWNAAMPEKGPSNQGLLNASYLADARTLVDELDAAGLYTIVDAHQDTLAPTMCGEGMPEWAVQLALQTQGWDDSVAPWNSSKAFPAPFNFDMPLDPTTGNPELSACLKNSFFKYYITWRGATAWSGFLGETVLHSAFAAYWAAVASAFANSSAVMGYELLNEPWPGRFYSSPIHDFSDTKQLTPLYSALHSAIRAIDDDHVLLFEPLVINSYLGVNPFHSTDFKSGPGGPAYDDRQAFAYHLYCNGNAAGDPSSKALCNTLVNSGWSWAKRSRKHLAGANDTGNIVGGFLTEFGAISDSPLSTATLDLVLNTADEQMQSWAYWTFKSFDDITTQNQHTETFYNTDGTLQLHKLRALSRTYAMAVAGTPTRALFSSLDASFELVYAPLRSNSSAYLDDEVARTTEIFLNEAVWYNGTGASAGFTVTISPADAAMWRRTAGKASNFIEVVTSAAWAATAPANASISVMIARKNVTTNNMRAASGLSSCDCMSSTGAPSFCAGTCDFDGSGGGVQNITVYRVTPRNVTDLANKNTGDAAGDIMFALSRVNLPQLCRADPSYKGCLMNDTSNNIIMALTVEVDGVWGPYFECNLLPPTGADLGDSWLHRAAVNALPSTNVWADNFTCKPSFQYDKVACSCNRALHSVGRQDLLATFGNQSHAKVEHHFMQLSRLMGGEWYSTPAAGQCAPGALPGDSSRCTWRTALTQRAVNASCVYDRIFAAVEAHAGGNSSCFSSCPQPNDVTTDCYIDCFYSTLFGSVREDVTNGLSSSVSSHIATPAKPMSKDELLAVWRHAFDDETEGGCPSVAAAILDKKF